VLRFSYKVMKIIVSKKKRRVLVLRFFSKIKYFVFFCKSCTFPALCQGEEKFFSGAFRFTVPGPEDDPFSRVEFCSENDI